MSCNGCRALRKGCSETCILRSCLHWIDSPESQAHATVFVAKFFGRAGLLSFISNVPDDQRPGLFQSLLFEACGRTLNPVHGAVGLLGAGNWKACQAAVKTVLGGGKLHPIIDDLINDSSEEVTCSNMHMTSKTTKGFYNVGDAKVRGLPRFLELDLSLSPRHELESKKHRRPRTPSEESGTSFEREQHFVEFEDQQQRRSGVKLLQLFK